MNANLFRTATLGLFFFAALSGCLKSDKKGDPTTTSTTPMGDENNTTSAVVRILNLTTNVNVTEPALVEWEVRADGNSSASFNITTTSIQWANRSVSNPQRPSDYGNTSGARAGVGSGRFSTNLTFNQTDTIYVRAYANVDGVDYWSPEQQITVGKKGQLTTVNMQAATVGYLSSFSPEEISIKVGDRVQWHNLDDEDHTATATSESGDFDTGRVAGGATSDEVTFDQAKTYTYRCTIHPQTMTGTITVTA